MQTETQNRVEPLTNAEIVELIKDEADDMDGEAAFEYLYNMLEEDADDMEGHAPIEKIMCLVRHAHLNGFAKALWLYNEVAKETLGGV